MTHAQMRVLVLRMGAAQELFIRKRLTLPETAEEKDWADALLGAVGPLSDPAWTRREARRLFWERELGMSRDWPREEPDCPKQGFSNGV